jgi:hypothetical protein
MNVIVESRVFARKEKELWRNDAGAWVCLKVDAHTLETDAGRWHDRQPASASGERRETQASAAEVAAAMRRLGSARQRRVRRDARERAPQLVTLTKERQAKTAATNEAVRAHTAAAAATMHQLSDASRRWSGEMLATIHLRS